MSIVPIFKSNIFSLALLFYISLILYSPILYTPLPTYFSHLYSLPFIFADHRPRVPFYCIFIALFHCPLGAILLNKTNIEHNSNFSFFFSFSIPFPLCFFLFPFIFSPICQPANPVLSFDIKPTYYTVWSAYSSHLTIYVCLLYILHLK
jgi:hypothetical protein